MIKANELRIGNWIQLGKNFEQVYQIVFELGKGHSINHITYKEDWLDPIPLTPEILEVCGFERNNELNEYWEYEGLKLWPDDEGTPNSFYHINSELLVHIDHLHQLQNLYFALTGTELEINLHVATSH